MVMRRQLLLLLEDAVVVVVVGWDACQSFWCGEEGTTTRELERAGTKEEETAGERW